MAAQKVSEATTKAQIAEQKLTAQIARTNNTVNKTVINFNLFNQIIYCNFVVN